VAGVAGSSARHARAWTWYRLKENSMTERLAEGADAKEAMDFDKIRSRFLQEVALHMDAGYGVAGAVRQPDHTFALLMEISVLAEREGQPQPFPWFVAFCARLMDEQDGTREPPGDPTVN
jgi:hypothetical protein